MANAISTAVISFPLASVTLRTAASVVDSMMSLMLTILLLMLR